MGVDKVLRSTLGVRYGSSSDKEEIDLGHLKE